MAIELISEITPKNNGNFPLVHAKDVLMPDGTRLSEFEGGGGTGSGEDEVLVISGFTDSNLTSNDYQSVYNAFAAEKETILRLHDGDRMLWFAYRLSHFDFATRDLVFYSAYDNVLETLRLSEDGTIRITTEQISGGGGSVSLDTTLTEAGMAADAKAVGDAFAFETVLGINLLDITKVTPNKNLIVGTGAVIDSTTSCITDYIFVDGGTTVSFWSKYGKSEETPNAFSRICAYDANDNRVDGAQNVRTYTLPETAVKFRASIGLEQLQETSKPMIVVGVPSSVEYEPYNAQKVSGIKVFPENVLGLPETQEIVKKHNYSFRKVESVCDSYSCETALVDEDTYCYKIDETYGLYDALVTEYPDYVTKSTLGEVSYTEGGEEKTLPIYRYDFTPKLPINSQMPRLFKILYCSGTHGIEGTPIYIGVRFFRDLCVNWRNQDLLRTLRFNCQFTVIPIVNPYGFVKMIRHNENQVDLNRNFSKDWGNKNNYVPGDNNYPGTGPASETSTQLIEAMIANEPFDFGLDHHTYDTYANSGKSGYLVGCKKRPEDSSFINMMGVWLNAKTLKDNTLITDFSKSHFQTLGDQVDFAGYMYGAFPNGICFENMMRWSWAEGEKEEMEAVYDSQKFSSETIGAIFHSAFVGYHTY